MVPGLRSFLRLALNAFRITRPFGRNRLLLVFGFVCFQALMQVVGVGSIYPFLAVAADPAAARASDAGQAILSRLPELSDGQLLFWTGMLAIVLLFLANGANLASEVARTRYGNGFGHWLRVRLLGRIIRREYGYFLQSNSSELLKKVVGDVGHYVNGVLLPLLEVLARSITTILLVAALVVISPGVALGVTLAFGGLYGLLFRGFARLRRSISNGLKTSSRGVTREANQLLGAIKPVKVHRVEEHFLRRFAVHSRNHARFSAWIPILGHGARYLVEPFAFGGLVVLILVVSRNQQTFTQLLPTMGVMALAGYRLLPAIQALYLQLNNISNNRYAMDEITDELDDFDRHNRRLRLDAKAPARPRDVPALSQSIEFRDLVFSYPEAERPVIDRLSVTIPANTSFAITGRTGSGKSTLVDLLLGLHQPQRGAILVDGEVLTPERLPLWHEQVGYVPQEIFLLDDTVAQNIAFGVPPENVDRDRLREAAKRAQILGFIEEELPGGFDARVGERGVRLSGGQRQRIGLARALYRRPSVLVLDEATSALDAETEAALVAALEELHGNLTMIVIAHRLSTIERCDGRLDLDQLRARPADPLAARSVLPEPA